MKLNIKMMFKSYSTEWLSINKEAVYVLSL